MQNIYTEYEQGFVQGINNNPAQNPYNPISYEYERWSEGYSKGYASYR